MPEPSDRGDVWLVDLGYAAKVRPCVVISVPFDDSDRALVTLIPHTTSIRGSKYEIEIKTRFLKSGAFETQNVITVSAAKLIRRLGKLTPTQMQLVDRSISRWLGLKTE